MGSFSEDQVRVTILMPVYDVGKYVKESIDSILAQTFSSFRLLIIDDCSTDDTAAVVMSYTDSRIRYVRNEQNLGLAKNLNKGLGLIDTEFVARFDGDDIAEPTWLEKNMQVMESCPDIGICSSGFEFFGTRSGKVIYPEKHEDSICQMLFGCTVIIPVIRMSVFNENNLTYDPDSFPAEDYHMWARCYRLTRVYNIQEILFHYRFHASQISSSKRAAQIVKTNEVRTLMLEWLSPEMKDSDKRYFLDEFCLGEASSVADLKKMRSFVDVLMAYNSQHHFDDSSLFNRLRKQVRSTAYRYTQKAFFINGYDLKSYFGFVRSGAYGYLSAGRNLRVLCYSILHKR